MSDRVGADTHRLMLHFGGGGPVELEVWDTEDEEAENVFTEYPDGMKSSEDLNKWLRRAGYELVEVDDE